MTPSGDHLFVRDFSSGSLMVLSSASPTNLSVVAVATVDPSVTYSPYVGEAPEYNRYYGDFYALQFDDTIDTDSDSVPDLAVTFHPFEGEALCESPDGRYVLLVGPGAVAVVDVRNRVAPVVASVIDVPDVSAVAVAPEGMTFYAGSRTGIFVFNISADLRDVKAVGNVSVDLSSMRRDGPMDLGLSPTGQYLFATYFSMRFFAVFDVGTDATQPALAGVIDGYPSLLDGVGGLDVSSDGQHVYVAVGGPDKVGVIDVSDPTNPTIAGTVQSTSLMDHPNDVCASVGGDAVFVTAYRKRLTIVDVSEPSSPSIEFTVELLTSGAAMRRSPNGKFLYVVGSGRVHVIQLC